MKNIAVKLVYDTCDGLIAVDESYQVNSDLEVSEIRSRVYQLKSDGIIFDYTIKVESKNE